MLIVGNADGHLKIDCQLLPEQKATAMLFATGGVIIELSQMFLPTAHRAPPSSSVASHVCYCLLTQIV